jgi:hypothetical protein
MKTNRVIRITRPMRVWFRNFRKLMNDVFNPEQSTHKWIRYPMYAINKEHKEIILSGLINDLNDEIKIKQEL